MGIRFRKSFKLAPGVRLNVGKSGMSWSLGPRGASVSIGRRGTYFNASVPGTGLSARVPLGGGRPQPASRTSPTPSQPVTVSLTLQIGDDGVLHYLDGQGNPVPPRSDRAGAPAAGRRDPRSPGAQVHPDQFRYRIPRRPAPPHARTAGAAAVRARPVRPRPTGAASAGRPRPCRAHSPGASAYRRGRGVAAPDSVPPGP